MPPYSGSVPCWGIANTTAPNDAELLATMLAASMSYATYRKSEFWPLFQVANASRSAMTAAQAVVKQPQLMVLAVRRVMAVAGVSAATPFCMTAPEAAASSTSGASVPVTAETVAVVPVAVVSRRNRPRVASYVMAKSGLVKPAVISVAASAKSVAVDRLIVLDVNVALVVTMSVPLYVLSCARVILPSCAPNTVAGSALSA